MQRGHKITRQEDDKKTIEYETFHWKARQNKCKGTEYDQINCNRK